MSSGKVAGKLIYCIKTKLILNFVFVDSFFSHLLNIWMIVILTLSSLIFSLYSSPQRSHHTFIPNDQWTLLNPQSIASYIISVRISELSFSLTDIITWLYNHYHVATHSSTLAWKIPWTGEPGRLQSMGSQRVRHDWETSLHFTSSLHHVGKQSEHLGRENIGIYYIHLTTCIAAIVQVRRVGSLPGRKFKRSPQDFIF